MPGPDQLLVEGVSKIFKLSIAITLSVNNVAPLCGTRAFDK